MQTAGSPASPAAQRHNCRSAAVSRGRRASRCRDGYLHSMSESDAFVRRWFGPRLLTVVAAGVAWGVFMTLFMSYVADNQFEWPWGLLWWVPLGLLVFGPFSAWWRRRDRQDL